MMQQGFGGAPQQQMQMAKEAAMQLQDALTQYNQLAQGLGLPTFELVPQGGGGEQGGMMQGGQGGPPPPPPPGGGMGF